MTIIKPNYKNGSILNLVGSIGKALGGRTDYNPLKNLNLDELKESKNIVLMVIDGLGYEYLMKHGKGSIFNKYLRGKITSVFPSATTAAIPAFFTGSSSQIHGMISWFSYLKEFGCVIIPLPYLTRLKPRINLQKVEKIDKVFNIIPFADRIKVKEYILTKKEVVDSAFSRLSGGKAKRIGYKGVKNYFKEIKKIIKSNNKKKFIFAYYPEHDHFSHVLGVGSKKVLGDFRRLNKELKSFLKKIKGTNTIVVITADHGGVDVPESKKIKLKNHPKLAETLTLPICGDNRYAFCFVKSSKKEQFENYIKTKLKKYCYLYKSKDLVEKGYFGLEKPSRQFLERIGDYTIIMKGNYAIYGEKLRGEKEKYNVSEHGGLSKEEMFVPLIVIRI